MLILIILCCAVLTSTLSGIFGMAGGMILMGIYASILPVPVAMVLHGVTQLASNGFRAWLLRRHVVWSILIGFGAGALVALGSFAVFRITIPTRAVFLGLGAVPLLVSLLPPNLILNVERRGTATLCGVVVMIAQLIAGASGPLLDIFFVRSQLDRYQVIATKAITQTIGHASKLVYFGALAPSPEGTTLPTWVFIAVIPCAFFGTRLGKAILTRLDDTQFRHASTWIVRALGVVCLWRGFTM